MPPDIDLTSPETSYALRRIAGVVGRGSRACAWALTTFEDEHRATVALVTPAHLEHARESLAYVSAGPSRDYYAPRWIDAIARFEGLLAEKSPGAPEPPRALSEWILDRVGLEHDSDPSVPGARKMGVRPTRVLVARHRGGRSDEALADAAALAADVFPVGVGWVRTARELVIRETGTAIATHLAYTSHRYQTQEVAEQRVRRFLALFEPDATLFLNGVRTGSGRAYMPLTLATFDFGMAVVDRRRVGIVVRRGED